MYNLAIEIGGYYTKIYKKNEGLVLKEPSLVAAFKSGDGYEVKAVGTAAKKLQGKTDENTVIFSPISNGEVKSVDYGALMLEEFLNKIKTKKFFKENAIIAIPCGLTAEQKRIYVEMSKKAGIAKVDLVPSIVCSSLESGARISTARSVFMVDIGGASTDVAIINMNDIIKGCTIGIGGRQMDVEIAAVVADKYQTIISIAAAQRLKEEIGSLFTGDISNLEVVGNDELTNRPKKIIVSSSDIREALIPYFEQIAIAIQTTINLAAPEIADDIVKHGIVVSGGVAQIPGLEKYFRSVLKTPVTIVENFENAAILGAGKLLSDEKSLDEIINNF